MMLKFWRRKLYRELYKQNVFSYEIARRISVDFVSREGAAVARRQSKGSLHWQRYEHTYAYQPPQQTVADADDNIRRRAGI